VSQAAEHHDHPPHLAHHFETPEQQFDSGKLGMWLFLATEILLFGGLFCAYSIYRANHPEIFIYAHKFLDTTLGGINTVILLCSSLTMAWAVRASQLGQQKALKVLLALTLLGGCGFLGIKYVEYKAKWQHGLLWGTHYQSQTHHGEEHGEQHGEQASSSEPAPEAEPEAAAPTAPAESVLEVTDAGVKVERSNVAPAAPGPEGMASDEVAASHEEGGHGAGNEPRNVQIFFGIYFLMTGLHGLHVIIGMGAIGWVLRRAFRGEFGPAYFTPVDLTGLYWHLVDLIWIFLFPLLYLIH